MSVIIDFQLELVQERIKHLILLDTSIPHGLERLREIWLKTLRCKNCLCMIVLLDNQAKATTSEEHVVQN